MTSRSLKPIYLLADSQLLFWKKNDAPFLEAVRAETEGSSPSAAYIGASNGDDPVFYSIFEAAMDGIGLHRRRMIPFTLSADDYSFMNDAQIVLLAGGDPEAGLCTLKDNGVGETIVRKYLEGAVLIGVSAGAVQLGLFARANDDSAARGPVDALRLVKYIIAAGEESDEWKSLQRSVYATEGSARGSAFPGAAAQFVTATIPLNRCERP